MKVKRVLNIFLAGALCVLAAMVPSPHVSAAEIIIGGGTTTDGNTMVPIKRKIKNLMVGTTVNNVFTYAVYPANSNASSAQNEPTQAQITFNNVEAALEDDGILVTATAEGVVDFTGAIYDTPGDYYYHLVEVDSSNPDYAVDEATTYYIMVSVRNEMEDVGGVETPTGNLTATVLQTAENLTTGEKEEVVFGAEAVTRTSVHVMTGVSGNAGDLEHCFKYKLEVMAGSGLSNGDQLSISYDDAGVSLCEGTVDSVQVGSFAYVYLKHHQQAVIGLNNDTNMFEIPLGAQYRVTNEDDDEYAVSANCDRGGLGEVVDFEEGDIRTCGVMTISTPTSDQGVIFSHSKTLSVLTGVSLKSLPYIVAGIISAAGIFLVVKGFINVKAKRS